MTAESFGHCRSCGQFIASGQAREHIGQWVYCLPFDSSCALLGRKAVGWTLTATEARMLLLEDALAAQQ